MRVYTATPGNLSLPHFDRLMTRIFVGMLHSWVNNHPLLVPQGTNGSLHLWVLRKHWKTSRIA